MKSSLTYECKSSSWAIWALICLFLVTFSIWLAYQLYQGDMNHDEFRMKWLLVSILGGPICLVYFGIFLTQFINAYGAKLYLSPSQILIKRLTGELRIEVNSIVKMETKSGQFGEHLQIFYRKDGSLIPSTFNIYHHDFGLDPAIFEPLFATESKAKY